MTRRRLSAISILFAVAALSACTSTDVLEPSAIAAENQPASSSAGQATATTSSTAAATTSGMTMATTQNGPTAAIPTVSRLQFAPIVGTPVEAAGPLSERLTQRARERGIAIARVDEPQSHILKGYFSALAEGKQTTVVYVWDVLDASGNRLHRIQGQQVVQGGEGWPSVPAATMQAIADQTMDQLATWFARGTG